MFKTEQRSPTLKQNTIVSIDDSNNTHHYTHMHIRKFVQNQHKIPKHEQRGIKIMFHSPLAAIKQKNAKTKPKALNQNTKCKHDQFNNKKLTTKIKKKA